MQVGPATVAPRVGPPEMTPHQRLRQRVDGPAKALVLVPAVADHDAAGDPPPTARIDFLL